MDATELNDIIENSNGDLRHLINTIQFASLGISKSSTQTSKVKPPSRVKVHRDFLPSDLHLVGKLLYGKGISSETKMFDDTLLSTSTMSSSSIMDYLHENGFPFFTLLGDIATFLDGLSCADVLGNGGFSAYSKTQLMCKSVLGRLMITSNSVPASNSFRPICPPQKIRTIHQLLVDNNSEERQHWGYLSRR